MSVRIPISILSKIDKDMESKKYGTTQTSAIIGRITDGYHLEDLMKIAENPELQKEMNEKIKSLIGSKNIEKTLETLTVQERSNIIFYAQHLNQIALTQMTM